MPRNNVRSMSAADLEGAACASFVDQGYRQNFLR
jgi:hypothetical protein